MLLLMINEDHFFYPDVVDKIMEHITDDTRTRKQVKLFNDILPNFI